MSNPANRLASYRSYAYYHVLVMCDSTETADALAQEVALETWEHATQATQAKNLRPGIEDLGAYAPKELKSNGGRYIILINGATDANYTITRVQISSSTASSTTPGDCNTSIAIEGSLKVSEPKGVAFLDQVVKCSVALGVDSSQVVFCLKTFFVGYTSMQEGSSPSDYITDIAPMTFLVYDVVGSFTEEGGDYEMSFVAAGHGAARLPQYSKSVSSFSITAGATLQQTFKNLEDTINVQYAKYFSCVQEQIKAIQGVDTAPLLDSLRRVLYVIDVSDDYKGVNAGKYVVTNQAAQQKNTSGCNDPAQITVPAGTSIETAIHSIMSMCPQAQDDMGKGDTSDKIKYEYKIHTSIKSQRIASEKDHVFQYTVYYIVNRSQTPKTISYDLDFNVLQQDNPQLTNSDAYKKIKNNIIEFDYLYTGKNVDILEFDMKVNFGMAYLQTATMSNTLKSQVERAPNRQQQSSQQDINTTSVKFPGPGVQIPIFFGTQLHIPHMTNTQDAGSSIQGAYTLTKHASIEVSDVTMKIYGNTELLGTISKASTATSVTVPPTNTGSQALNTFANFSDWPRVPAYAKVNIKMPRNNDDFSLFTGQSISPADTELNYARDFWFDGYYYVYGIDHLFDGGEFTQTLQMIVLPKKSAFDAASSNATTEANVNTKVDSCFDNKIGCGPSSPVAPTAGSSNQPNVAVAAAPTGTQPVPTNHADARSINSRAYALSDVALWDDPKTPQASKTAILNAAKAHNVDPTLLAQFAYQESKFQPTAKAPGSTATGLFQYIDSTWINLVKQDRIPGVSSSLTKQQQLAYRTDPTLSANAAAENIVHNAKVIGSNDPGDLYLAHFAGEGRAKKTIQFDNAGQGNTLMSSIYGTYKSGPKKGQSIWDSVVKANPGLGFNANTTASEFRTFAAQKMARTLKNNVAIVTTNNQKGAARTNASPAPAKAKVKASDTIAICQDCKTQNDKPDVQACGVKVDKKTQDSQTQPSSTITPGGGNIGGRGATGSF